MTAARRPRSVPTKPADLGKHNPLARLQRWFETIDPHWWTGSVNFHSARPQWIAAGRSRWKITFSLYGTRWGYTRSSQIRYEATIMASPWRITLTEQRRLTRAGWYEQMSGSVRKLGYRGTWHQTSEGKLGIFQKRLRDLEAVKLEVARLDTVRF